MIIYGVKMIALQDITANHFIGRPTLICDYLQKLLEAKPNYLDDISCNVVITTDPDGNLPLYNIVKPYKFVFVPIDFLDQKILIDSLIENLEGMSKRIVSKSRKEEIEKRIDDYECELNEISDSFDANKTLHLNCYMFVFEGTQVNVFTCVTERVITDIFLAKQLYTCDKCKKVTEVNNTSIESFAPNLFYTIINNKVIYYCKHCRIKFNVSHVGSKITI